MTDKYEKAQMFHWFKGMHLLLSLGGDYVRKRRKEWRKHPIDFNEIPFYELFRLAYDHACHIRENRRKKKQCRIWDMALFLFSVSF
jgi:hypothetical protein